MIEAKNVHKYFGGLHVLKDISFKINKGEIVGFLGQNGAGKTTLMRLLTSYLPASSGAIMIDGRDVQKNPYTIRKKIGYLPEVPPLYMDMSVGRYLTYAAQLKEVSHKQIRGKVDQVLDECQLTTVENKLIATLSLGFRQRVGIAQAIINDPQVLILDEPTKGLDPVQILHVRSLIKNLEQKRTVLISTHILSEIEQIAQRVLIIKSGSIVVDDLMSNLLVNQKRLEDVFLAHHT